MKIHNELEYSVAVARFSEILKFLLNDDTDAEISVSDMAEEADVLEKAMLEYEAGIGM
jgi:hypothetical protein